MGQKSEHVVVYEFQQYKTARVKFLAQFRSYILEGCSVEEATEMYLSACNLAAIYGSVTNTTPVILTGRTPHRLYAFAWALTPPRKEVRAAGREYRIRHTARVPALWS